MSISNILFLHHSGKRSRAINFQPIIKHLYLNICTLNTIVTMSSCIHHNLSTYKLTIFFFSQKYTIMTKVSSFLHLYLNKVNSLLHLIKNTSFENHILDNIHIFTNLSFSTVITNETYKCTWEEKLRILTKE